MTESLDTWNGVLSKVYESHLQECLKMQARWAALYKEEHDAWWVKQTRWFKVKYRTLGWLRRHRDNLRYRLANAIYPYPGGDE